MTAGAGLALAILVAASGSAQVPTTPANADPDAGADNPRAPALSLTDLSGHKLELAQLAGKVVLLDFWATWCAPCRQALPELVKLQARHGGQGLQVIGISLDESAAPVRATCAELGVSYPVALGDAQLAVRFGGILGLPVAFLIDRSGRIVRRYEGETAVALIERDVERLLTVGGADGGLR